MEQSLVRALNRIDGTVLTLVGLDNPVFTPALSDDMDVLVLKWSSIELEENG